MEGTLISEMLNGTYLSLQNSIASQILRDLADSYSLVCSIPALSILTYYLDI